MEIGMTSIKFITKRPNNPKSPSPNPESTAPNPRNEIGEYFVAGVGSRKWAEGIEAGGQQEH